MPPVALFTATSLVLALTAGFGLGLWLLLARTFQVTLGGASWLALVQVHGFVQLFGFVGLFTMGVGLHLLPRLRRAPLVPRKRHYLIYALALAAVLLRSLAQPAPGIPAREMLLTLAGISLVLATVLYAATALMTLVRGENPHRADELVIAAGVVALPVAATLAAIGSVAGWPLIIEPAASDRATWAMLLGCIVTTIIGVWARLAPGFVAARPAAPRWLVAGTVMWLSGVAALILELPLGPALLVLGMVTLVIALGVWGPTIAHQTLAGHARLTRIAIRSGFVWALAGCVLLVLQQLGLLPGSRTLTDSAVRHAFALGLVTLAIYGVAARALPSFLGRRLWSLPLQVFALVATDLAVGMRVVPQVLALDGGIWDGIVALSGILAYAGLVAFAVNVIRTFRAGASGGPPNGQVRAVPITFR